MALPGGEMKTILGDRVQELITELKKIPNRDQLDQRNGWLEGMLTRMLHFILKRKYDTKTI